MTVKFVVPERFTKLVADIQNGDPFDFIDHLNVFYDINFQDPNTGDSLLHSCINYCNYPALVELISRKADVNIKNKQELTPLHIAIWKGFLHLAAPLLKAGANQDAADSGGRVPLYFAVERGDIRSMRLLLDFHADPNVVVGKRSLLAIASRKGYPEAIKLLLDSGAIFNRGQSHPLIEVLVSGNREAFAVLVHEREHELPYLIIDNKPFITIAIKEKTMLLPVIAAIIKKYTEEAIANGDNKVTPFPPPDLTGPEKTRLEKALKVTDSLIPIDTVNEKVKKLKSPWSARGIDEFECLEASYAGGDTVYGEFEIPGGQLIGNYIPDDESNHNYQLDPALDDQSVRRDYFDENKVDDSENGQKVPQTPKST
ncbi:hypothetical protein TVAG_208670 [Trichomonas vaginalis G3]|uniref:Uncharacterized protein n=1 Tax=Trichomonas vaginalis (strain ATCC PRA-98 / G3) TaxID=412133 RepID=A2F367_TRIV3|nr:spectrin binding [Trichomonas vaginalis G3]EAY00675.1 hypothetical protein TVAG_208670 [Trichomonas vaginalis G3]KAI5487200.1 spectrin binding [Trichomonas vaginalis G3]|eukprot:XP_001313604.1 hypothetical protein [Trichomonas vaginalis G3]